MFDYGVKRSPESKARVQAALDSIMDDVEDQVGHAMFKMFLLGVAAGTSGACIVLAVYLIFS